MGNLLSINSPLWNITNKILNFVWLSLLWLVFSLPIVTVGASTAALYTVMLAYVKNQEGYLTSSFFQAFRQNFKKATVIWVIELLLGGFLMMDLAVYFRSNRADGVVFLLMTLFFCAVVLFFFTFTWCYGMTAKFENTVRRTIANALVLSICHWPSSLIMVMAEFAILAVGFTMFPPLLFTAPALMAWINSRMFNRAFEKLLQECSSECRKNHMEESSLD